MDTREFDRAIDKAARELMAHEPSRALSYKVMVRVRQGQVSTRHGAWVKAACVCAASIVVAYLAIDRPAPEIPTAPMPHVARSEPPQITGPQVEPERATRVERRPPSQPRGAAVSTRAPMILPPASVDVAPIEPIRAEPIAVMPIEVPQLAREATSIENITIDPLTIEPLVASND